MWIAYFINKKREKVRTVTIDRQATLLTVIELTDDSEKPGKPDL
jgi:hypothetical protein